MKEHNEQLDLIEEVLQQLIQRINAIDEKLNKLADVKPPEQVNTDTKQLQNELKEIRQDFNQLAENILFPVKQLNEKVAGIPKRMPVEHHHHFNVRSKGFIIGAVILLIVTAGSLGLSLSLYSENSLLHENALKYRMIRLVYPAASIWADSTYNRDPKGALTITDQKEERQEQPQQAVSDKLKFKPARRHKK
ncbi:MAG TPA: hypothetical protein VN721_09600 [Flavipsychrobacter sp.]|nr:hypothetical protein [Flavipsychrobacter sp.]